MWNQIKTVLLLGALSGLMLGVGYLLGGTGGLTIALIFALIMNVGTYWFSDKIVLWMYRAKEAKRNEYPKLHSLIEDIARRAHLPKPKLYVIPGATPNAFATGRNPHHAAVACTEGIMQLLSDEELKGVLAHEMAHIKNRDILITTIAATIAAVISYVAAMARWAAIFGGRDDNGGMGDMLALIVLSILTPFLALMLQLAISRSREYFADETGARIIKNPRALAAALRKLEHGNEARPMKQATPATSSMFIVNPFSAKGLVALLSTHPPMDERIKRLEALRL